MRVSIVYFSKSGNTMKAAEFIREGILSVADFETKLMNIATEGEVDKEYLEGSDMIIIGAPTYTATMCWQMKQWLDTYREVSFAGKLGGAFATARYIHGGGDITVSGIINHELTKGMIVYSSGAGCGAPVIHLGPVALGDAMEQSHETFVIYGKRMADQMVKVFQ